MPGTFTVSLQALRAIRAPHTSTSTSTMAAATRQSSRLRQAAAAQPAAAPAPAPQAQQSRKRKKQATPPPPARPSTPPPAGAGDVPQTPTRESNGVIPPSTLDAARKKPRNAAVTRLADPNRSNATLLSPESSRIVASRDVEALSPSKKPSARGAGATGTTSTTTTTATLLDEACAHLISVDERMRPLVEKHYCRIFSPEGLAEKVDPFDRLASGIISQQVSGAAAKSIKAKFVALFEQTEQSAEGNQQQAEQQQQPPPSSAGYEGDDGEDGTGRRFPHPSEVAACSIERLRTAGLSQRKAEYIKGLADKFVSGELSAQMLHEAPYDEIFKRLIAVRGLGQWSVEMFACFGLKRLDICSMGDLGVQRGMAAFVGRDVAKLKAKGGGKWKYMSEADMKALSERFAPYRSLFMWYMWRVEETDVSTME